MRLSQLGLLFLVACSSSGAAPSATVADPPRAPDLDAGAPVPAPTAPADAGDVATCSPSPAVTLFPRVGPPADDTRAPLGPGLVLMGGGPDVDAAFVWMRETALGATPGRAGDLVVLRASGADGYDAYAYATADFASVQTILVGPGATPGDLACVAGIVSRAEVVFFAGGDQSKYVAWKGTPLMAAVQSVHDRGGVVGGTSAGCAILGELAYDAVTAGSTNVATSDAIADPFEPTISFARGALRFPSLAGVITDPHFRQRDRMGRLAAFMARQHTDGAVTRTPPAVLGVGVDEGTALVVDRNGDAHILQQSAGTGAAYLVRGGVPDQAKSGVPLVYRKLQVTRLASSSESFSFRTWCGTGSVYRIGVFGDAPPPYEPRDPYDAKPDGTTCSP